MVEAGFPVARSRGEWPYSITWNWAAGYGLVGERRIRLQSRGDWTDGTGSTEQPMNDHDRHPPGALRIGSI